MSNIAVLVTNENVTLVKGGHPVTVSRQYADFNSILAAIKRKALDEAYELANRALAITKRSKGVFKVDGGIVYHNGVPVHNAVARRITEFVEQGLPFEPLVEFLKNLFANPNPRSVEVSYPFLEKRNLPVTMEGHFLAYKTVQGDYRSKSSGTNVVRVSSDGGKTWVEHVGQIPNNVGNIIEVDRDAVDSDENRHCSYGLHVGALSYAGPGGWFNSSGDKVVIVKVNPRDIVSVPTDHDGSKMRVCRYEVIADFVEAIEAELVATSDAVEQRPNWWRPRGQGGRFLSLTEREAAEAAPAPEVAEEDDKDSCPECGSSVDWYEMSEYCGDCGYDANEYDDGYGDDEDDED